MVVPTRGKGMNVHQDITVLQGQRRRLNVKQEPMLLIQVKGHVTSALEVTSVSKIQWTTQLIHVKPAIIVLLEQNMLNSSLATLVIITQMRHKAARLPV